MEPRPGPSLKDSLQRIPTYVIVLCGALAIVVVGAGVLFFARNSQGTPTTNKPTPTAAVSVPPTNATQDPLSGPVSPLIFGTNLGLFTEQDQVITSPQTVTTMQQLHVRIVRMPTRKNLPDTVDFQAAQAIKTLGAIPLVALRGAQDANPAQVLADDTRMINTMKSVFGDTTVYYEFGNEDDLAGIPIADYTQRWNALVPQLKKLAPRGHFIGPVSFEFNTKNVTQFLQNATPRPDEISWHEYTCSVKDQADKCLSGIDKWTQHISDARSIMKSTIGNYLPILITEWNYASDQKVENNGQPIDDGKYNNEAFMTQWTNKALETLAKSRVFASMQYSVTNTAIPLIANNGSVTTQGTAFQKEYQQLVKP